MHSPDAIPGGAYASRYVSILVDLSSYNIIWHGEWRRCTNGYNCHCGVTADGVWERHHNVLDSIITVSIVIFIIPMRGAVHVSTKSSSIPRNNDRFSFKKKKKKSHRLPYYYYDSSIYHYCNFFYFFWLYVW